MMQVLTNRDLGSEHVSGYAEDEASRMLYGYDVCPTFATAILIKSG